MRGLKNLSSHRKEELLSESKEIEKVLGSKSRLKSLLKRELQELAREFGDDRRSPIEQVEDSKAFDEEELISTTLSLSLFLKGAG